MSDPAPAGEVMSGSGLSAGASLPPTLAAEVNRVCDRFEAAWQDTGTGAAPSLEDFLVGTAEPVRSVLLRELLALELTYRERRGECPSAEEYRGRFPGHVSIIRSALAEWIAPRKGGNEGPATGSGGSAPTGEPVTEEGGAPAREWAQVAGYEILGELGRGGMGVVYRARQVRLNRVVALKMILSGSYAGDADVQRFQREAEAVARLQHPNIVHIYEVGQHDGMPYFSLEFCRGGSLADRLDGTPWPAAEAAQLVQTLAGAVQAAHQARVVHRDLKPANVLLQMEATHHTKEGKEEKRVEEEEERPGASGDSSSAIRGIRASLIPKVADFGLAKQLDDRGHTPTDAIMGTPSYMAPEQASGKSREVGPAADVYALGAILYELLTGRPPFKGPTPWDTLVQVVGDEPVPPRRLQSRTPRDLETICLKCLEKEAHKRYASAAELGEDLGRFLRREPIRARPATSLYRLGKFAQRNKGLVAGVVAVLLALAGGTIGTSLGMIRAEAERDRARAAEAEANRLLAASYRDGARLAMRRGDWRAALDHIDRALAADPADPADLHLDRVRALCAVHEIPRATQELEELSRRTDQGDLEGQVLLWRADLALNRSSSDREAALGQVRQALDRGLPPAEAAYARGLLAPTSPEAVEHFRQALRADPFNPRANGMLALLLACLGRRQEAREQVLLAETLFPDDPSFRLVHGMLLALEEDMSAATAQLEQARGQLADKQMATARAFLELCHQIPRVGRLLEGSLSGDGNTSLLGTLWQVLPAVTRARAALRDPEADLYLPVPPVLHKAFGQLPALGGLVGFGVNTDELAEKLGRVAQTHPEGFLYLTRGVLLGGKGGPAAWAEAEKAFLRAAELPSLFPIRQSALFGAAASEWVLSGEGAEDKKVEMGRRAVENAHKVVALGVRPDQAYLLSTMALEKGDVALAGWIIYEWERQTPRDSRLEGQHVLLAFHSGAYGRAIDLVDQIVRRQPQEAGRWQKLRDAAVDRLRKQGEASRKGE